MSNPTSLQLWNRLFFFFYQPQKLATNPNNVSGMWYDVCCVCVVFQVRRSLVAHCLVLTGICVCMGMETSWKERVGWHSAWVNFGCHYLFWVLGWLSCLTADGCSSGWKHVVQTYSEFFYLVSDHFDYISQNTQSIYISYCVFCLKIHRWYFILR